MKQSIFNPKTLKQLEREKIKTDDKELAKKMINPSSLFHDNLKIGFKINLESDNINHAISILTITPTYPEFEIEFRFIIKIIKKLCVLYARLINQYNFKNRTLFSATFYKIIEEDQRNNETDLFINLNVYDILTESDIDIIDVIFELEYQVQNHETKKSGWIFDRINSVNLSIYNIGEINGSSYVEFPLRSSAFLNIENID